MPNKKKNTHPSILQQEKTPQLMLLIMMCLHLSLPLFSVEQQPGPKFPWPLWQSVGDVMIHNGD